jgi:signal transduction histidine kinase
VAHRARRAGLRDPVPTQVQTTLFRGLVVARVVVAGFAVVVNALRWHDLAHPAAGWVVVGVIVGWTAVTAWAYDAPRRRVLPLLVLDLAVTAATLLATPYVQGEAMVARGVATMPSFWVLGAVLAWAIARGWAQGMAVALLVSVLDLSVRRVPSATNWGNIFLLLLAAGVVGYSAGLVRVATEARAEAERVAAVLSERARLARAVHDGVLQVLALVQRRGSELGGEAGELARLAGQQEVALRALVQGSTVPVLGERDLVSALALLGSPAVTVSGPAGPVLLPAAVVDELTAVVRAALDNVTRHVGPDAPAWVLVEELPGQVLVSVRDEGPGLLPGRLAEAEAEGRLGVSGSIRGRMADLGGAAELRSSPGAGTEWELVLPR